MRCPTCASEWWWTREGTLEDYTLHMHRLHLMADGEELLEGEMELEEGEELPVETRDAEAVFVRLDVLREQQGEAAVGEEHAVDG